MVRRCAGRVVLVVLGSLVAAPLPMLALAPPAGAAAPDPAVCPIADSETETECRVSTAHSVSAGAYAFHKTLHVLDGGRIQGPSGTDALALVIDGASGGAGDLIVDTGGSIVTDDIGWNTKPAAPLTITTSGDVVMQAGSVISARDTNLGWTAGGGGGGAIAIDAGGDGFVMCGAAASTELDPACSTTASSGATITTDKIGPGAGNAGPITLDVGDPQALPPTGAFSTGPGSAVRANGRNAAGDISIAAGHHADIAGRVLSQLSSLTADLGFGRDGASISLETGCGLTVAPTGLISSRGRAHGADLVHLESCEVTIDGTVESTGLGYVAPTSPPNHCAGSSRPDKAANTTGCVEVWAKRIAIGASGQINADVSSSGTFAGAGQSWVDLLAADSISVVGATGPGAAFALHANSSASLDRSTNTVTAKVLNGTFGAGGRALSAKNAANGAGGGSVIVEAAGDIDMATAEVLAVGDPAASFAGAGGDIAVRSATGALTWADGTADVRPNTTGTISLTSCVAPVTNGTNFNGATPALVTDCTLAPSLPAYAQGADGFLDRHCDDEGEGGGEIDAPPLDPTVPTNTFSATQFLYTGEDPLQVGVEPDTIEPLRAGVVRGRVHRFVDVLAGETAPLAGVKVSILDHPEYGSTRTRADGFFDLAVNGGGHLSVVFEHDEHFSAQRGVDVAWQEMAVLDDVVLVARDAMASGITLSPSAPLQVHSSSLTNDERGQRRATLLIPPATTATMTLPDGSTQPLASATVRATEYTVGPSGPAAMPAELPPTSGYTYAAELSIDEAQAAGATNVTFNQPIYHYVENFIGFPVGQHVPAGYYDDDKGQWIPSTDGRVIAITGASGALAAIDTTGDGVADDAATLAALGFSDAELTELATRYGVGQSLWRVPVTHFTTYDYNWPYGPPSGGSRPGRDRPGSTKASDRNCLTAGSVIECQSQVLGEDVGVVGAPFALHYRSDRAPGRVSTLRVPLTSATPPAPLKRVELRVDVAGARFQRSYAPAVDLAHDFTWNGRDAYGRLMAGAQSYKIRVAYVYDAVYYASRSDWAASFGSSSGVPLAGVPATGVEIRLDQDFTGTVEDTVGGFDARGVGLGGWTPSIHHTYDPASRTLHLGTGERRSAEGVGFAMATVPLAGDPAATSALGIAPTPDGSFYMADSTNQLIRHVDADGAMTTVAGNGTQGFSGDDGPGTAASFDSVEGISLAPDGTLYIADSGNNRIRRLGADGIITTVAGSGSEGFSGDGGPASEASLFYPMGVAVSPDGSLLIADTGNLRIRRVGTDGVITTVAGNGVYSSWFGGFSGDGGPATAASLSRPRAVAVGPDGSVFIADTDNHRIRRVGTDGVITTVAGNGELGPWPHDGTFSGDGGPATSAALSMPRGVAVGPDGSLYVADVRNNRVRRVGADGRITTVAGTSVCCYTDDGGPPTATFFLSPQAVAVGPAGDLLVGWYGDPAVKRVAPVSRGLQLGEVIVPSATGDEAYVFSGLGGRHLRTIDALTGVVRYRFAYDSSGHLSTITDADGNVTTIEHDAAGDASAIVAPFGQRTTLTVDANGYLASITNPAGEAIALTSSSQGLLTSLTDPRGNVSRFTYDASGLLVKDEDAGGGSTTLVRTQTATGHVVTATTAEGRVTRYETERLATGEVRSTTTDSAGLRTSTLTRPDGTMTLTAPDGTTFDATNRPDPRFGMLSPITQAFSARTPAGRSMSASTQRSVTLSNPNDQLALATRTDVVTAANGAKHTMTYDAATRTNTRTSRGGRQTQTVLDELGHVIESRVPGLASTHFAYDGRGLLTSVSTGEGLDARRTTATYNDQGLLASITDPAGRVTSYTYDAAGRVLTKTLPDMASISFSYDANANLTSLTPPERPAHGFAYDPRDLPSRYDPPSLGPADWSTSVAFNRDRQLTSITLPGAQVIEHTYDPAGRLASTRSPSETVTYAYDPMTGRLASASNPAGTLSATYDGALISSATSSGVVSSSQTYAYDASLRLAQAGIEGSAPVTYAYDLDSLPTSIGLAAITWDPTNATLRSERVSQAQSTYDLDAFLELRGMSTSIAGATVFSAGYARDALGRITAATETLDGVTHERTYAYDLAGRLTEVRRDGALIESYAYDAQGNPTTRTRSGVTTTATYDDQDRLVSLGDATYTYAASGRLASVTTGSATTTYDYDAQGALRGVGLPSGARVDYVIDAAGRRVAKLLDGALVEGYVYEGGRLVATTGPSGAITTRYVYTTHETTPTYFERDGRTYRIVADHLGSPRVVADATTGEVLQRLDYDSFGLVSTDTNEGFTPFGFAGGLYDPATGLVHFGARDYDPASARWTAKDPAGFAGGDTSLYAYAGGDPVNFVDTSGLLKLPSLSTIVHTGLDVVGLIPGLGEAADLANAAIYLLEGDCVNAAISLAAAIPIAGSFAVGARYARKYGDEVAGLARRGGDDLVGAACSFSASTTVVMADGTRKAISEVKEGDYVLATDPETGETGPRQVLATLPHTDQLLTLKTSSGDVVTTEDHRYWNASDGEWQESQELDPGDRLLTADGDEVAVEGLDWSTAHTAPAYDLTVEEFHSFYVAAGDESVLVHNSDRCTNLFDLPSGARTNTDEDYIFSRLETNNGISRETASDRLHEIKREYGLAGDDNVVFDMSGNVYDPVSGDLLGSLTQGGA